MSDTCSPPISADRKTIALTPTATALRMSRLWPRASRM